MYKKKSIFIIIILVITSIYLSYDSHEIKINEDLTLIIPNQITKKISKDFISKSDKIISIIQNDPKNGYSIGLSTPSLTKQGVKKIYNYLKQDNACIDDIQGYYDLENISVFEEFWEKYQQNQDCSFTYYTIMQTGNVRRTDFYYKDRKSYVIYSYLIFEDENHYLIDNIYGYQIEDLKYDDIGFFSYRLVINDKMKFYGCIEYKYIRIKSLGEKNREYTQKYINTIDYHCTNIFTQEWNKRTIDDINFSDLFEYLYELEYQKPFYATEFAYSTENPFIKEIPAYYFEKLTQKYFDVSLQQLRQQSSFDRKRKVYLWREAACIPSKVETPSYHPEVINIEENKNQLTLTVRANAYEHGYTHGFTHKVSIEMKDNGFHYTGNTIIYSPYNNIPKYTPGATCESINSL